MTDYDRSRRMELESEMISYQIIVSSEHRLVVKKTKSHFKKIDKLHILLLDAATGGCFQQEQWEPDYTRAQSITKCIQQIVNTLQ